MGILLGGISALAMGGLYWIIHLPASLFMGGDIEGFEQLSTIERFFFPIISTLLLIIMTFIVSPSAQKVGVVFVIERLNNHQGNLPFVNSIVQFFAAAICLAGGLSIGKEGPAVHIGATFGSFLARKAKLPVTSVEVLVACGIAGAISALFQTPLAGVLFALEVVLLEYRLSYILPVLLASVAASLMSGWLLGELVLFSFANIDLPNFSFNVYFACVLLALVIVLFSFSFYRIQKALWLFSHWHFAVRFACVGLITACLGGLFPEVLGSGFDSLSILLDGGTLLTPLFIILLLKLLLTGLCIGLGIPGGMIGPTFLIGGLAGVQVALLVDTGIPFNIAIPLFALIGMSAMMAATFQAPLTALIAIIEITNRSEIMLPAMMVIGLSCLIIRVVFQQQSLFAERLHYMGLESQLSSSVRFLRHHSIDKISAPILLIERYSSVEQVQDLRSTMVDYVAVKHSNDQFKVVRRNQLLKEFETLALGPQSWITERDGEILLDLERMVDFQTIQIVAIPDSLETMLKWFNEHQIEHALIQLPKTKQLEVVEKSKLYHSLLSR
ncbi:chloride channel protein [Marinomonas sp. 15G1-11]|uniref:Chloride channel protein n=1 Tax=Marinomonas phaeophyticola TaxID=3004091 RepID=A0ABT4JS75_9GAMM|nr:chloride channel protein [Marinomonas sp. 15G1-11]MCZ2721240.1 chloride channel protein [Marinomonas sp. 15G1-11]